VIKPLNPLKMKITLQQLIKETAGINPVQFEVYCETNKIETEWLDVTLTDFNEGFYNVTLPDYNDRSVFASDGSEVEIELN
jgi:hypothetical protein